MSEGGKPMVMTFYDADSTCEMELLEVSESGLCRVRYVAGGHELTLARHRDRIRPLNARAREMLGRSR